ncbi:MAG: hypothetical protein ACXADW_10775 [Candidatus Hodarchaeales archaeon]|jgi:hypothetical protein
MKGYIRNKTATWRHAMKRSIGPGHQVELDEIYEQYGEKHDLDKGAAFVKWLRSVKLKDKEVWEIVYNQKAPKEREPKKEEKIVDLTVPFVKEEIKVEEVVGMSVRRAREELKKITNLNTLKYAYREARQLAHKDTLCIMLRKRIQELELTRR